MFYTWLQIRMLQGANGFWVSLLLFEVYKRFPLKSAPLAGRIGWVIALSYGFSLILVSLNYPIYRFLFNMQPIFPTWERYVILAFSKFFILLLLGILFFLITYLTELKTQKEKTLSAVATAKEAQLQMLQYQLNPHFLFNALNSVRTLLYQDTQKADEVITDLSDFLRYSLSMEAGRSVRLSEEIEVVRLYFRIQKIRFEERLNVSFDFDDAVLGIRVPCFLLQPLVENAVKYGLETSPPPLCIRVSGKMAAGTARIMVENSGTLCPPKDAVCNGTGLRNVRLRLEQFFPGKNRFELRQDKDGVSAVIGIDLHDT